MNLVVILRFNMKKSHIQITIFDGELYHQEYYATLYL